MKCRSGDLAIIISAGNPSNVGKIVRVLQPFGTTDVQQPRWKVRSWTVLTFTVDGRHVRRKEGIASDAQLDPINGPRPERWRPGCQEELIGMDDPGFVGYMDDRLHHSLLASGAITGGVVEMKDEQL